MKLLENSRFEQINFALSQELGSSKLEGRLVYNHEKILCNVLKFGTFSSKYKLLENNSNNY
jgi:hypothetical protein